MSDDSCRRNYAIECSERFVLGKDSAIMLNTERRNDNNDLRSDKILMAGTHRNNCDDPTTTTTTTQGLAISLNPINGHRMPLKLATTTTTTTTSRKQQNPLRATLLLSLVLYSLVQIATIFFAEHQRQTTSSLQTINSQDNHLSLRLVKHLSSQSISSSGSNDLAISDGWIQLQIQQQRKQEISCSSIKEKISLQAQQLLSSAHSYLSSLLKQVFNIENKPLKASNHQQQNSGWFAAAGPKVLFAQALAVSYNPNQDKGIIILNSTNFNSELIQYKHPFPHLKLIEYFLPFSTFCVKFKATYTKLAKEIHPWRNVIRPSALDLGISSNSPIAHSWSIEIVPTLRVYPPPKHQIAKKLNKQLASWNSTLSPSELQKSMSGEYKSVNLMLQTLNASKYLDNVSALKSDLLLYIERYVRETPPSELPFTWPNLRPVVEPTLDELRRTHPRQELFLIIEQGTRAASGSDQSSSTPSLGLTAMVELSSSAVWRAIRYVNASENKALIEDVIVHQKKASEQQQPGAAEQVELLNNLLSGQTSGGNNNILLVHIDDSHSPTKAAEGGGFSKQLASFPFLTIVTGTNLVSLEQSLLKEAAQQQQGGSYNVRAKRAINHKRATRRLTRRSLFSSDSAAFDELSSERKIELMTLYIKQTYTETSEDREFVRAINNFDENPRPEDSTIDHPTNKIVDSRTLQQQPQINTNKPTANEQQDLDLATQEQSMLTKIYNVLNIQDKKQQKPTSSYISSSSDYDDKLKAIRYILFNEVPRTSIADKSLIEQQEKLNILVNLVTVIKSYFPLPDLASIQFIDGVQSYLLKQQSKLSSVNTQERGNSGFDTRAFKQELKRLENEDKRLPELKEWKHCKHAGYPCALWRLFHTLTAFEYKKLVQIRQPSSPPSTGLQQSENSSLSPSMEAVTMNTTTINSSDPASPVERLVSPPSTTTSLSLTIATPTSSQASDSSGNGNNNNNNNNKPLSETDLPMPVILVMRDYITTFFSCKECQDKFRIEAADLSLERIRQQEPAEFSILWLWETHNRVNKRLSVDPETNPKEHPKVWFPTYEQCSACYKKPPSFLKDATVDDSIFKESIEWNKQEVLCFLLRDYTKQPMDNHTNLFGYQVPHSLGYIFVTCLCCLVLIVVLRCTTSYIERQRRHKATLLNGNGAHYSVELQG